MSDEAPETPEAPAPAETAPVQDAAYFQAEAEKWKALSRQNEAQAKSNAEKAQKFDQLEEANKTELQKAQDALTAAQQRATEAEARALRSDIARTKGVPVELLTATDETALNMQADTFLSSLTAALQNQAPTAPASSGAPTPSGAATPRTYKASDLNDHAFFEANRADIMAAYQDGRIDASS